MTHLKILMPDSIKRQGTVEAFYGLDALNIQGVMGYWSSPSLIRIMMGEGWTGLPGNPDHRGETLWCGEYAKYRVARSRLTHFKWS